MMDERIKIGALAKRTGLTVRTLHHYDELGLLRPKARAGTGKHRLYGAKELERLQRILSLKAMGFSLEQIQAMLDQPEASLKRVLDDHIDQLDAMIQQQQRLRATLLEARARLELHESLDADTLIQTIEETVMFERYYTPDQLEALKARAEALGEEAIAQVQQDWAQLFVQLQEHLERGTAPDSPQLKPLMDKWDELVRAFTGGDAGISSSLNKLYEQEKPEVATHGMMSAELAEYAAKIRSAQG